MRVVYLNIVFVLSSFQSSFVGEVQEVHFSSCLSFFSRRMGLALSLVSDVKEKVAYMGFLRNVECSFLRTFASFHGK